MGSPDQHFRSVKEASDKLLQAESEMKKLLVANKEASDKQLDAEKQLLVSESEKKRLLLDKEKSIKETYDKLDQAEKKF